MAKDVITRFKLETTAYDSKLRDAAKGLANYTKTATTAGKEFGKFTQSNVEAARALGNITPSANNAKDKVKELVGAFNEAASAYNHLTKEQQQEDFAKAMAESLGKLKVQIAEAKQELYGMGDAMKNTGGKGGFLSGMGGKMSGSMQVFAGNMYTKAAEAVVSLGSEMYDTVKQGVELARQGEGIRIAFERLGRGDILEGLREATHGTVTDLELMKAAVKFNDFKLPVEELGTMLAFAQQKAKDTGQSVDYMVDSIVTGLGRKSLMILDNLGLSASEIKERMAETGDMTKAVGAIIRDQMSKAGDYVETAADRAAQANVSLQNKMEELGRKFAPVEEASNQLWTSMKIGILDIVGGPLARLLNDLTEAGRLKNALNDINGDGSGGSETRTDKALRILREYSGGGRGIEGKRDLYNKQVAKFQEQEERAWRKVNEARKKYDDELKKSQKRNSASGLAGGTMNMALTGYENAIKKAEAEAKAFQIARATYERGAQHILNPAATNTPTVTTSGGATGGGKGTTKTPQTELQQNQTKINDLTQQYVTLMAAASEAGKPLTDEQQKQTAEIQRQIVELEKRNGLLGLYQEQAQGRLLGVDIKTSGLSMTGGFTGFATPPSMSDVVRQRGGNLLDDKAMKAVNESIRKEDPNKEFKKQLAVMDTMAGNLGNIMSGINKMGIELPQGLTAIVEGTQSIISIITSIMTLVSIISSLTAIKSTPIVGWLLAEGGIVGGSRGKHPIHAATGTVVPGSNYSGDMVPAMLNSGELVLNRAQQGNLASQLEGGGMNNLQLEAIVTGEQLRFVLNTNSRRRGMGEYVTSTNV